MPLNASRLNSSRFTSILADINAQFPVPSGLLPAEVAQISVYRQKMAHSVADHEGTDVVGEVTVNALVNTNDTGTVTTGVGAGGAVVATGVGTVS